MSNDLRSRVFARGLVLLLVGLSTAGCAPGVANPVDPDRARVALKAALDHWKNGGDPLAMPGSATPMTVQDLEWQSGAKLLDYEVLGDGEPADANLRVKVKLTLAGKTKKAEKTVNYLVTTSPAVTVFRDMLRR
jgi:hypothetical protein